MNEMNLEIAVPLGLVVISSGKWQPTEECRLTRSSPSWGRQLKTILINVDPGLKGYLGGLTSVKMT